jgi:predicted CXXCH cytochrome family protein
MKRDRLIRVSWLMVPLCAVAYLGLVSCSTTNWKNTPLTIQSAVPNAEYVGAEACVDCHEDALAHYKQNPHSVLAITAKGHDKLEAIDGCEACHGPGSVHVEKEGAKGTILRDSPKNCMACHMDVASKLRLQHHHPVIEGRVTCADCHDAHGKDGNAKIASKLKRKDEKCFKCHKEQKGPYVFEHEAMREGCQICHDPHGSVNDKMLIAGQSITCLRCHYDINTNPAGNLSGGVAHGSTASTTGKKGGNFDVGRGEECVDHHRAPHGSNIWRTFNR